MSITINNQFKAASDDEVGVDHLRNETTTCFTLFHLSFGETGKHRHSRAPLPQPGVNPLLLAFGEGSWCTPVWWFEGSVLKQNTSFSKAANKNIQTSSVALKHVQVVLWYVPLVLKMLRSVRALEVDGLRSR